MSLKTHRQLNRDHNANFPSVLVSDWPTQHGPHWSLRASTGHSVLSNWWAESFNHQIWNGNYLSKTGDNCYQTWYWLHCQNCNRNRTNFWTSVEWCFYEICTICKWQIASYITSYDRCIVVLHFIRFAGNIFLYLCLSHISLCWRNESPVVNWFELKWGPKSFPEQGKRTNSSTPHLGSVFSQRCLARSKGDCPFYSGFGPTYSWCHTPACGVTSLRHRESHM